MGTFAPSYLGYFKGTMVPGGAPPPPPPVGNLRWWSDSNECLSSAPTEYDVAEIFTAPVHYSTQSYNFIVLILNRVMAEPIDVDIEAILEQLSILSRRSIRYFSIGLLRGDIQVATPNFRTDRTFKSSSCFRLADIRIFHRLFTYNVTPPTGGFSITLGGIIL